MSHPQPNNPLHGIKLKDILEELVDTYGRDELYEEIPVNCFKSNQTIASSLKFLRNVETEWARKKVEDFYVRNVLGE